MFPMYGAIGVKFEKKKTILVSTKMIMEIIFCWILVKMSLLNIGRFGGRKYKEESKKGENL